LATIKCAASISGNYEVSAATILCFELGRAACRHEKGTGFATILIRGGYMANLKGLESVVSQLREERTNLINQLQHIDAALSVLGKLEGGRAHTKPRRRRLSASARRRIAAAQRARWARVKGQSKSARKGPADVTSIRTMSAAARRKIGAAQRKRWAKLKQQKRRQGNNRATRL